MKEGFMFSMIMLINSMIVLGYSMFMLINSMFMLGYSMFMLIYSMFVIVFGYYVSLFVVFVSFFDFFYPKKIFCPNFSFFYMFIPCFFAQISIFCTNFNKKRNEYGNDILHRKFCTKFFAQKCNGLKYFAQIQIIKLLYFYYIILD